MAESENLLLNEFCAADTGATTAQSRLPRLCFKGPAPPPVPATNADQCLKPTLNACKSFNRNRIVDTTLCRWMGCHTATKVRKRTQLSLGLPTSSKLKRSKISSSAERKPSIDDLPDVVLVEILCRLPCNKFVFQCKSVSKRWCTLIADPYFIGRFVSIQSYKRTPKMRTLINKRAVEFPPKVSLSPPNLLTQALKGLMCTFHFMLGNPVVVATYNDLILCCTSENYQCHYYVWNAYTKECVALPPTPSRCHKSVRVGFICNFSDYKCKEDDWKENNIQLNNAECRWTVVRILPPAEFTNGEKKCDSFKLNVEVLPSDTGEWRESIVSSPRDFDIDCLNEFSFAYNGMLYWLTDLGLTVIGLGPFYDNDRTSSSSSSNNGDHKLGFTIFEEPLDRGFSVQYLGVCGGYVRMCNLCMTTGSLYVYELKESQDAAAGKKLCLSKRWVYSLDPEMFGNRQSCCVLHAFDPNNKDILYLRVYADIIKCNIRTGKWSKIVKNCATHRYYYTVVLPWWPTPIPRLAQLVDSRN
ncbi:hypothetical protein CerSpe_054960 [Prunus speciosa]